MAREGFLTSEETRIWREKFAQKPDVLTCAELFRCAVQNQNEREAAALLASNGREIALGAAIWRGVIPQLEQTGLIKPTIAALKRHADEAGWEGLLVLGEMQVKVNDPAAAETLWKQVELKSGEYGISSLAAL